jgi:sec-independent protein translocase protein TatC
MSNLINRLWRIISFPFRILWILISFPFKGVKRAINFLNEEPDDIPLSEAFATTVKQPSAFLEHFDALRKHLTRMVIALVIGVGISATFATKIIDLLSSPIGGINTLQAIDVTESVGVFMRVALISGFALALPYIAFEFWLFAAPGLHSSARWMGLLGIPLTLVFFLGGMAFAYYLLLPTALPFLLSFMGIHTIPRVSSYVEFVTGLLFWIGVAFEFPLIIYVLSLMGLVKPKMLAKNWRYAIVIIAIVAAAVTPTVDPVNMSLVMAPMIMLYILSIGLSQMAVFGRRAKEAKSVEQLQV